MPTGWGKLPTTAQSPSYDDASKDPAYISIKIERIGVGGIEVEFGDTARKSVVLR